LGHQTAEEAREQYVRLMGPDLGRVYDVLRNDLSTALVTWTLYRQLYSSQERITLFNDVAGTFFGVLQDILLRDTLLALARLVDREETGTKQNLTLQRLPSLLCCHPQLQAAVAADVASAKSVCEAAVDWRNRRIAHRDLDVALSEEKVPLPEIPFDEINGALTTIAKLLNRLEAHFNKGATVMYEWLEMGGGGVESLVFFLQRGLEAERSRDGEL
jgi:hypothetical protein